MKLHMQEIVTLIAKDLLFLLTVVPVTRQGEVGVKVEAVNVPEEA